MELIVMTAVWYFGYFIYRFVNSGIPSLSFDSHLSAIPVKKPAAFSDKDFHYYQSFSNRLYEKYKEQVFQSKAISEIRQRIDLLNKKKHSSKTEEAVPPNQEPNKIMIDRQSYLEILRQHYLLYQEDMFLPSRVQDFVEYYQVDFSLNIQADDVVRDLWRIREMETEEKNRAAARSAQTREKPRSVLDEQKLLNDIKAMPVEWRFNNPGALENKALQELCSDFLGDKAVAAILSPDRFRQMEFVIQKKRARIPKRADYGKVMDRNILYELYEYSYLMSTLKVLENRKNETFKIDRVELWSLIQEDCRKRLENLDHEAKINPAIPDLFRKYELDTSKVKMVVNDLVEPREYDYIYASSRTDALSTVILDLVLDMEKKAGEGFRPTLQALRQYSALDVIAALNACLSSATTYALGSYANGRILAETK